MEAGNRLAGAYDVGGRAGWRMVAVVAPGGWGDCAVKAPAPPSLLRHTLFH